MKLLNNIKRTIAAVLLGVTILSVPAVATAAPSLGYVGATTSSKQTICKGAGLSGAECDGSGSSSIESLLKNVIQLLSVIVGIAGIVMVIVSGLKYVTSGGDASKVSSAKSTLIYALIGLVVAALAQVMVRFVLSKT